MAELAADLLTLAQTILRAIISGDEDRVQDILPVRFRAEIAQAAARARAAEKFG